MAKKHKKHHHEEHVDESWLIPYADLLTLLLALFIVLFASSQIDSKKFMEIARAFNSVFTGGTGALQYLSPIEREEMDSVIKDSPNQKPYVKISKEEYEELKKIQSKFNEYVKTNQLSGELSVAMTEEGLLVTIANDVLFDSGSADIKPQYRDVAKKISNLLVMNPPRNIVISGHTDNVPINNAKFASNWELSVMRAVNFMKLLLENTKLNPQLFSAKGYGEFKPIASNATPEGRAKNRRVEILIMPQEPAQ
ncbi:chemotaxis protein MotB [Anoxybacillus tengchongensis]|uniref:Chemotaxis protein MotB n=1 Tax=Anoxybacillus tengchongensis TaxID=576944 RepID=A0A7W9YPD0_9BACL|nr:flagellar motor protein MotB [Anoxybacillus tengchongensis]MBB6175216.1 chemotaxis protein MotB [Anoxybacillus tengchongensis]